MNGTPYIFGNLKAGYCQYPTDYTAEIFQGMFNQCVSEHQLVTYRQGELIYYAYIVRLSADGNSDEFIGLCMMLNGEMMADIKSLYPVFQDIINGLIRRKKILERNYYGRLRPLVSSMTAEMKETSLILKELNEAFEELENSMLPLPHYRQEQVLHNSRTFTFNDDSEKILRSTYENEYTFLYKYTTGFHFSALAHSADQQLLMARRRHQWMAVGLVLVLVLVIVGISSLISDDRKWLEENPARSGHTVETKSYLEITAKNACLYLVPDKDGGILYDSINRPILVPRGTKLDYRFSTGKFHEVQYKGHRVFVAAGSSKVITQ